jgi:hypothetical protein
VQLGDRAGTERSSGASMSSKMNSNTNQSPYESPWWARWRWQLSIQLLLLLTYLLALFGLVAGEPFIAPDIVDLWVMVGLPAVVTWIYFQMALGFVRIITRMGADGAAYSILIMWNLVMSYHACRLPSEFAADVAKQSQLRREAVRR